MKQSRKPIWASEMQRESQQGFPGIEERMMLLFSFNIEYQTDIHIYKRKSGWLTVNSPIFFVYTPIRGWFWDLLHRRNYVTYWYVGKSISFEFIFQDMSSGFLPSSGSFFRADASHHCCNPGSCPGFQEPRTQRRGRCRSSHVGWRFPWSGRVGNGFCFLLFGFLLRTTWKSGWWACLYRTAPEPRLESGRR